MKGEIFRASPEKSSFSSGTPCPGVNMNCQIIAPKGSIGTKIDDEGYMYRDHS